jgi:CheY-like chemotaxis protein
MTRILVVDDDPLICTAIRAWLEAERFEVVLAGGARACLHALAGAAFDVMIIDIFMPEMDGLESIGLFHRHAPAVPIIAISGHKFTERHGPAPDFLNMSTHLGAAYCLRKPFGPKDLLHAIEQCLPGRAVWLTNDTARSPGAHAHAS